MYSIGGLLLLTGHCINACCLVWFFQIFTIRLLVLQRVFLHIFALSCRLPEVICNKTSAVLFFFLIQKAWGSNSVVEEFFHYILSLRLSRKVLVFSLVTVIW